MQYKSKTKENDNMFSNVEQATAEIENYAAKELKLVADHRGAIAKVSAAELSAGEGLLDAPDGESAKAAVEQIVRERSSIAAIEASIRACRARRLGAIRGKIAAEAAEWRQRADEAGAEQERITAKAKKHLDALKQLEGVEFIPASTPKSSTVGAQAFGCDDKAVQMETAGVPRNGGAQLDDVTSAIPLVEMVLRHESDGPSAQEVLAWAAACDPHDRFGNHSRSFRVSWTDGVIDYRGSYCQVAALAPSAGISIYTLKDFGPDMAQAIFRAPVSMQPVPRITRVAPPTPEPPVSLLPGDPAPVVRGLKVDQYLGYEYGRRRGAEPMEEEAPQS
jgi:hypothetical protein